MPSIHDEPKTRKHVNILRYKTPSRNAIVVMVLQSQDALGNWMVPLITYDGPSIAFIESARFASELADALKVAVYFYDKWMVDVKLSAPKGSDGL